jgi:hypothetical protein
MDFDQVFYKAVSNKFKFEESDHNFSTFDGWADYYATDNVPETAVNPLNPEAGEVENLSSIEINFSDVKVSIDSYGATMVPYGDTYVEYEPAGWEIDDVNCSEDVKYTWEGDDITREQYLEINKMSDDELKAVVDVLKETAMDSYWDWLDENYEPPEPEPPEPDYDDYWR